LEAIMDLQPWMAQLGAAGVLSALLLVLGRSYIAHVASQVKEMKEAHLAEMARLTASWEARLTDAVKRADSWETAAERWRAAGAEDRRQVDKLASAVDTVIALLSAIREEQLRR
jgi:poly(3-hydroxyalkanoate) synthetase